MKANPYAWCDKGRRPPDRPCYRWTKRYTNKRQRQLNKGHLANNLAGHVAAHLSNLANRKEHTLPAKSSGPRGQGKYYPKNKLGSHVTKGGGRWQWTGNRQGHWQY